MTDRPEDPPAEPSSEHADAPSPPRRERRGSAKGLGGRRATDRRGKAKEDDSAKGEDDAPKDEDEDEEDEDEKEKKPSPLKETWVRIVIAVVVVLLLIALIWWAIDWFTRGRYVQNTNDAYIRADKVAVTATVAAKVERIDIVDNQVVKAGDLLVELDTRATGARLAQYDAQAAQARALAEQYRQQIASQEATILQYEAQARATEVQRDYYAGEAKRYAPLAQSGAEREEQLAQLLQQRDTATQNVRQYRAAELSARRQIGVLRAQIAQAEAQEGQAIAQKAQAAVDYGNSMVRAAVDGRVGDRQIFLGTYVNAGTQMMTIIPIAGLYVEANFKETQLGLMRVGQPVTIRVDALDGTKVNGWVESFSPATGAEFSVLPPQNATGNFTKIVQRVPVRIRLDAGPEARRVLVAGLSVVVDVDTIGAKDAVDRREQEEKDRKDRVRQQRETEIRRERDQLPPGPGR